MDFGSLPAALIGGRLLSKGISATGRRRPRIAAYTSKYILPKRISFIALVVSICCQLETSHHITLHDLPGWMCRITTAPG